MASPTTTAPRTTTARRRVIDAAGSLFASRGIGGTSLQMIADEIGVTKAAVYHQFRTKEAIVLAVAEAELDRVRAVIDRAEASDDPADAVELLVSGAVGLAVEGRHTAGTVLNDPAITDYFTEQSSLRDVLSRMQRILMGRSTGPQARVRTAMLIAAISGAATSPMVARLDDESLREELLRLARRFLHDMR